MKILSYAEERLRTARTRRMRQKRARTRQNGRSYGNGRQRAGPRDGKNSRPDNIMRSVRLLLLAINGPSGRRRIACLLPNEFHAN